MAVNLVNLKRTSIIRTSKHGSCETQGWVRFTRFTGSPFWTMAAGIRDGIGGLGPPRRVPQVVRLSDGWERARRKALMDG